MIDDKILVFAGTFEGRKLCEYLDENRIKATACVATDYGRAIMPDTKNIEVHSKRLNTVEMEEFIRFKGFKLIIDATHPYAKEVTNNIRAACERTNTEYIRLLRDESKYPDIDTVSDTISAVEYLKRTEGNILVTTGSKELSLFCDIQDYEERLFVRVLPSTDVIEECKRLGFHGRHLICMQGPFSQEMNIAMLKQFDCRYLVTKNTGMAGGFDEKISAALQTGTKVLLIDRPQKETGYSYRDVIDLIKRRYEIDTDVIDVTSKKEYFPLFVSSKGKKVLVAGGGKIASRRIAALRKFCFDITVVSPDITDEIAAFVRENEVTHIKRRFLAQDLQGCDLVIAATDDRDVNHLVGKLAKSSGLYVSVADKKEECNFFFPAVILQQDAVIGVTSEGKSHKWVKEISDRIREI